MGFVRVEAFDMTKGSMMSHELWEAAYLYSTEALFVTDADGALLHWSESLGHLVGSATERGTPIFQLFHPDDRDAIAASWARLPETAGPLELRGRGLTAQGSYVSLLCVVRRAPHNAAIYGTMRQPPGVKTLAGSSSKEQLADLLGALSENLPVIIWAINTEGIFTYYDGNGLQSLGMKPGQFVGMNIFAVFRDLPAIEDVKRALRGNHAHTVNEVFNLHWENWVVPILDSLGNVESVVGLSLNISEQKKAEQELQMRLLQIEQQRDVIGKLSTPIIQVWEGVLALPMIGIVDSARTADIMQKLLDEVVRTGAHFAILDLTGVEMVDTQVAKYLVKLVDSIRLLGAGGIVCGIRPSVAQTMVDLGLDLTMIVTRANLKAGLMYCIEQMRRLTAASTAITAAGVVNGGISNR
ncbi:PAS domain S-box protein [Sorangium sp. So ce1128]